MALQGLSAVLGRLATWEAQAQIKAGRAVQLTATQMESYAKTNRPWQDRTGTARRSIAGTPVIAGTTMKAYISIGVYYGKYLELSNGGRYRVVLPTLNAHRSVFLNNLKAMLP